MQTLTSLADATAHAALELDARCDGALQVPSREAADQVRPCRNRNPAFERLNAERVILEMLLIHPRIGQNAEIDPEHAMQRVEVRDGLGDEQSPPDIRRRDRVGIGHEARLHEAGAGEAEDGVVGRDERRLLRRVGCCMRSTLGRKSGSSAMTSAGCNGTAPPTTAGAGIASASSRNDGSNASTASGAVASLTGRPGNERDRAVSVGDEGDAGKPENIAAHEGEHITRQGGGFVVRARRFEVSLPVPEVPAHRQQHRP